MACVPEPKWNTGKSWPKFSGRKQFVAPWASYIVGHALTVVDGGKVV
jgi:hypothetical protein